MVSFSSLSSLSVAVLKIWVGLMQGGTLGSDGDWILGFGGGEGMVTKTVEGGDWGSFGWK